MPNPVSRAYGVRGLQRIGRLPIASGQTFKVGDFLTLNASGLLQQSLTAGNNLGAVSATNLIVGRAIEDAQPSTNDVSVLPTTKLYGEFIIAEPGTQFELPIWHGTATSAYPNANQVSVAYELRYALFPAVAGGTTAFAIAIDATTNIKGVIVDFVPDDLIGSTYALWPDIGSSVSAPSSGTQSQYARAWVEFIGVTCALTGARPVTRS